MQTQEPEVFWINFESLDYWCFYGSILSIKTVLIQSLVKRNSEPYSPSEQTQRKAVLCLCALKWLLEFILPNNDSNIMGLTLDFIQQAGEELAQNECIGKDCRREKWDCFMITPFVSSVFSWLSCFTYLYIYLCMYHVYVYVHRYA